MSSSERARSLPARLAMILERIATNAPLQGTLDELVALLESQISGAIGSLLLL